MTLTRTEKLTSEMDILLTTAEYLPNYEIEYIIGIVSGSNILDLKSTKLNIKNKGASLEKKYSTVLENARDVAIEKMVENAIEMDADAVINIKIETNVIEEIIEFYVYGTAVHLLSFDEEDEYMDDEDEDMDDEDEYMDDEDEYMDDEDEYMDDEDEDMDDEDEDMDDEDEDMDDEDECACAEPNECGKKH